jgi:DNA polymerase-3 subunit gamma/tau
VSLDSVLKRLQDLRSEGAGAATVAAQAPRSREADPSRARTERSFADPAPQAPAVPPAGVSLRTTETATTVEPDASVAPAGGGDLEVLWARLVEAAGRASPFLRSYLLEAHPVSFAKNLFIVGFDPEFSDHIALVDNSRNHTLLQTKLSELGYPNAQFKFIKAEAPAGRAAPAAEPAPSPVPAPEAKAAAPPPMPKPLPCSAPAPKEKLASVPFSKDDFKNDPLIQKALEIFKGQIVEVRA